MTKERKELAGLILMAGTFTCDADAVEDWARTAPLSMLRRMGADAKQELAAEAASK